MKRTARVVGILVALLLAVVIAIPFLIDANQFRPALESRLTTALGREVKLGNLKVSLFSGAVSASDLSVADDPAFSSKPFLSAQSVEIHVRMWPLLFSRKLEVTGITIDQPQIALIETPQGVFNFSSIGGKSAASSKPAPDGQSEQIPSFSVASLKVSGGRLAVEKTGAKMEPLVLNKLNLEVKNFQPNAEFPFSFDAALSGGGTIKLDGSAGPLRPGEVAQTPFKATLRVTNLDLLKSGFVNPAAGLSGLASFDGSAQSANGSINMTGKINAERLVLSKGGTPAKRPVQIDVAVTHDIAKQSGDVRRMMIHVGNAAANISGTYSLASDPATVNLRLTGSKMPVVDLATLLPPLNVSLPAGASIDQGTADVSLASQGALDNLVTRGTLQGENVRLANYDFASKLQVLHEFTGIKAQPHTTIQSFRTNVSNTNQGTALDNLQLTIVSVGTIAGAGNISSSHALNFKMRAAVGGGALASLGGAASIPFTIQGTSENPSIRPDVKNLVGDQLKNLQTGKSPATDAATGLLKGLFGGKKKK